MAKAIAYLRTSSTANLGEDRDSESRQRAAIESYAARAGFTIVAEYYDAGISGTDELQSRPAFSDLLARIEENGVRIVVVEDASRLSRELMVQEAGIAALIQRKVKVFASNGDELTATDDPMRIAMRQMAGAFAQLEKSRLVAKLKSGRDRKIKRQGWCWTKDNEHTNRAACDRARALKEADPSITLRAIGARLADEGMMSTTGKPFAPKVIMDMLKRVERIQAAA